MQRKLIGLLISLVVVPHIAISGERTFKTVQVEELTRSIPARAGQDFTGSQFVRYVSKMNPQEREHAILDEILRGNLPDFLRKLVPVELHCDLPGGKSLTTTIFVAPDYLGIGSDDAFFWFS